MPAHTLISYPSVTVVLIHFSSPSFSPHTIAPFYSYAAATFFYSTAAKLSRFHSRSSCRILVIPPDSDSDPKNEWFHLRL
jgi:hypothetical protein